MEAVLIFCVAGEEIEVAAEWARGVAEVAFAVPLASLPSPFYSSALWGTFTWASFQRCRDSESGLCSL